MKALVDIQLETLLQQNIICHSEKISLESYIQPASIDIPVGTTVYHVKQKFLPFQDAINHLVEKLQTQVFDARNGCTLYKGQTYMIPCLDVVLPPHLMGKVSPKSSLGRIDVLIRAVVDNTGIYDTILPGTQGTLRLQVTPQSFNIHIKTGSALTQLMIFDIAQEAPEYDHTEAYLFSDGQCIAPTFYENKIIISAGVGCYETIGYKARYTDEVIDITQIDAYPRRRFFEKLHLHGSGDHHKIVLEKERFYILPTKEAIRVPPQYAIELMPSTHLMGELRVHYAGFFDPGFGGETGATGVLEVRPFEDIIVYDGQPICLMEVYTNTQIPQTLYGAKGNNYQGQLGPKLAKYFKMNE